jgi:peptidylprolyl isomerase
MKPLAPTLFACAAFGLAACGSSGNSSIQAAPSATQTTTVPSTPTTPTSGPLSRKPTVGRGSGAAPTKLVIRDLIGGTGPAARNGQQLTVNYVGVLYANGKEFDASWKSGTPFPFQLGAGNVIPGWDRGLVGMRVGGRRELIIPAALAYGAQAQAGIPANSPLIFVVDLLGAQ